MREGNNSQYYNEQYPIPAAARTSRMVDIPHTGISDQISIQALVVQIQGLCRYQMKPKASRY